MGGGGCVPVQLLSSATLAFLSLVPEAPAMFRNWKVVQGVEPDTELAGVDKTGLFKENASVFTTLPTPSRRRNGETSAEAGNSLVPDEKLSIQCVCGNVYLEDSVFCRMCGIKRPGVSQCSCGNVFLEDSVFCNQCGVKRFGE